MPQVNNHGINIHYQLEGEGPALVLQHGSGSSLHEWYQNGCVDALKATHRLILIDARGFGNSDKPHDEASYALHLRVSDVVAVLDDLGIEKTSYWGYSMGGWIGFGMARYAPQRIDSLILGGAHPYADSAEAFHGVDGTNPDAFIDAMETFTGLSIKGESRQQLQDNDLCAFAAAMHDRASIEAVLPSMQMPCFLYAGEEDPRISRVCACARLITRATFMSLPGLDHEQAFSQAHLVLPSVLKFMQASD